MTRPLFNPGKMRQAAAAPAGPEVAAKGAQPMRVSDLAARIGRALEGLPSPVRVVGEVSGFNDRTHWYFGLKDESALVNCVMFASAARRAGFALRAGMQVVATGRVEFYSPQGKVSLIVDRIEPVGAGARDLALRQLIDELRGLGWLDESRKRPLPAMPRRVGVITSRTGAALQDVLDTLRRRCCAVEVALIDVRVQGEGAAAEIAGAVRWAGSARAGLGLDAIILTRGGGSTEDLWAFNERVVAQAVLDCPVPVCAAIGHETDTTVAELVADARAATPTQAAMRVAPDAGAILEQLAAARARLGRVMRREVAQRGRRLEEIARRSPLRDARGLIAPAAGRAEQAGRALRGAIGGRVRGAAARVDRLDGRLGRVGPAAAVAGRRERIDLARRRLERAARARLAMAPVEALDGRLGRASALPLERAAGRVRAIEGALRAVSPLGVLGRGYSVTMRADGRLVRSSRDVRPGERLRTRLQEGEIGSMVEGGRAPARRSKRQQDDRGDQMGLFSPDQPEP